MVEKTRDSSQRFHNKSPKSQSERTKQGTAIEQIVKEDLLKKAFNRTVIKSKEGVDIIASDGVRIAVEVKGALTQSIAKNKNGKFGFRKGRYVLKKKDCEDSDVFAFVEKKAKNGKWLKPKVDINYIRSDTIKKWLKDKGKYQTGKSTKITIDQIKKFPKAHLHA